MIKNYKRQSILNLGLFTLIVCFWSFPLLAQKKAYLDKEFQITTKKEAVYFADVKKTSEGTWRAHLRNQPGSDQKVLYTIDFKTKKLQVKHGQLIKKSLNGSLMLHEHYQNDTLHGDFFCKFSGRDRTHHDGRNGMSGIYSKGLRNGNWTFYRWNGTKEYVMSYDHGKQLGKTKFYDYKGNIKEEGALLNGQRNGYWTYYYHKKSRTEIEYKNGIREGQADYYDSQGYLERSGGFINDKEEGKWLFYGKTEEDTIGFTFYKNGLLHGKRVRFNEKGDTVYLENYYEHKEHGVQKSYHKNGTLKSIEVMNHGNKEGTFKKWFDNGQLEALLYYKNDLREGQATFYFANGQMAILENWKAGKQNGTMKHWEQDGQLVVSGNYKNHKKHGVWKTYSSEGKLIKTEEYMNGFIKVEGYTEDDYPSVVSGEYEASNEVYIGKDPNPDAIYAQPKSGAKPVGSEQLLRAKLQRFVQKNYPVEAIRDEVEGTVKVQLIINQQGEATDFKVIEGIGHGCDEVAIQAIRYAGPWHYATQYRKAVKHQFELTIQFNLPN